MNIEQAMLDPTSVFASPEDIFYEQSLTRDQKINLLRRWEYDARELQVADEDHLMFWIRF